MNKNTYILGIESSCDDTAAAVIHNGVVLSNVVAGQKIHEEYGGVVPELASRAHQQNIVPVVHQALRKANIDKKQLSAIAFTQGPGLMGSLLVKKTKGETINLGNPKETRIVDLANMVIKLTDSKSKVKYLPMPDNDPRRRLPKITKARQIIGFNPRVKLNQGLSKTIEWQINR